VTPGHEVTSVVIVWLAVCTLVMGTSRSDLRMLEPYNLKLT
jgi:hypothetical protein